MRRPQRILKNRRYLRWVVGFVLLFNWLPAWSDSIEIGVLVTTGEQRSLYSSLVDDFRRNNPGVEATLVPMDDKTYKESLTNWMKNGGGPDILFWQGGERLFQYARVGKIASLTRFWESNGLLDKFSKGSISAVSIDGEIYGVPLSYYQWGFYYRKSLFEKLNLRPPETWEEFLDVCRVLKRNDVTPITIGNKFNWPSAAWFDYLNLRINGLDFHLSLLIGEIPFTDERVRRVFEEWKSLLDKGYFVKKHRKWKWDEAMPFLYHKMAGMTLMGNFFAGQLPPVITEDVGFFRFPVIDPNMPVFEEAPLDLFMIPAYSKNKRLAEKFLLSVSNAAFQEEFAEAQGMISPNINSRQSQEYFIKQGTLVLNNAAGLSQFFDRDTNAEMASVALGIFADFLENPNVESTLNRLEMARQKHLIK